MNEAYKYNYSDNCRLVVQHILYIICVLANNFILSSQISKYKLHMLAYALSIYVHDSP